MMNWPFGKKKDGIGGEQPAQTGQLGVKYIRKDGKDVSYNEEWKVPKVFEYRPREMTFGGPEGVSETIFNDLTGTVVKFAIDMKEIPPDADVVHIMFSAEIMKRFVSDAL